MAQKEIDVTIGTDGEISLDQLGFQGKDCAGAINELMKILGKEIKNVKKAEYYKKQKVKINQRK
jgi:hypothetical protein